MITLVLGMMVQLALAQPQLVVLGTAQDAGFPQAGCMKECQLAWKDPSMKRFTVSLALVDPEEKKWWLIEATPDIRDQLNLFQNLTNGEYKFLPEGIFLTHAHIGHYTGLMFFGRESTNTKILPVYTLPRFADFLQTNGPWGQLVSLENIALNVLTPDHWLRLTSEISILPFAVPHRDEFSETAGFKISLGTRTVLFIPDIDKWEKWGRNIVEEVQNTDLAFLDGPFYSADELPNRDMSEIPHPYIPETMTLFEQETKATKAKIHFIHFNHSNPVLWDDSVRQKINSEGFNLAEQGKFY